MTWHFDSMLYSLYGRILGTAKSDHGKFYIVNEKNKRLHQFKPGLASCNRKPEIVLCYIREVSCSVTWHRFGCKQCIAGSAGLWSSGSRSTCSGCPPFFMLPRGLRWLLQLQALSRWWRKESSWVEIRIVYVPTESIPFEKLYLNFHWVLGLLSFVVNYVKIVRSFFYCNWCWKLC